MSRRSTSRTTTVLTSTKTAPLHNDTSINMKLLQDDEFEKRPKTDYTYSRSATYSNKYVDGKVVSPNLSRRRLYTTEQLIREEMASSALRRVNTQSHVRVYGSGRTRNSLAANQSIINVTGADLASTNNRVNNDNVSYNNSVSTHGNETVTQHTLYTTRSSSNITTGQSQSMQSNNNNSEAIFSGDESSDLVMSRSGRRKSTRRASSRSRSPRRSSRAVSSAASSSRRRSTKSYGDELDSNSAMVETSGSGRRGEKKGSSYALSSGLDSESDTLQRVTNQNTRFNSGGELVTERSSTIIDTVATGTPITAKLMGCVLFIYGCTRILVHRLWYNFGHPIYATLQRCLLLDSWILSRNCTSRLRSLILGLLLLLVPLVLLSGGLCGLHYLGWMNVGPCAKVTGVYYVNKRSDINAPGMSVKIRTMLNDWFTWNEARQPPPPPPSSGLTVDWEAIIEARLTALRSSLELKSNAEISVQRQKNTDLEAAVKALTRDVEEVKLRFSTLADLLADLTQLKTKVSHLTELTDTKADRQVIAKLQADMKALQTRLGAVDVDEEDVTESGVLVYLQNEIKNLRRVVEKQKEFVVPKACPESNCVCESDLGLRLRSLHDQLLTELNEKGGTTVYVTPDNSTGISEQFVRKLIQDELDIFSADKTGMPDFALQSMGAQIVSTRCSQTYYQDTGIMTYFGLPLYHLHKDPSVVIQPGVTPGECWCFHGQSGSMVIELAESVQFNSFSLEHISASQSVTGEILSAPRDLEVYGLKSELDTEGRKIGEWRYENTGPRLQFFPVQDATLPGYPVVELRILNNWGKKEFTCLYRFRVHGRLAPK